MTQIGSEFKHIDIMHVEVNALNISLCKCLNSDIPLIF